MKKASITEAKNKLSALIDAVKQGDTVLITDRRRPVARLVPAVSDESGDNDLRAVRLERAGVLRRRQKPLSKNFFKRKLPRAGSSVDIVATLIAEREESW